MKKMILTNCTRDPSTFQVVLFLTCARVFLVHVGPTLHISYRHDDHLGCVVNFMAPKRSFKRILKPFMISSRKGKTG